MIRLKHIEDASGDNLGNFIKEFGKQARRSKPMIGAVTMALGI